MEGRKDAREPQEKRFENTIIGVTVIRSFHCREYLNNKGRVTMSLTSLFRVRLPPRSEMCSDPHTGWLEISWLV